MNLFEQDALDCGAPEDFDFTKPFLKVQTFKESGKWYSTQFTHLAEKHVEIINDLRGFNFIDTLKENPQYSPVATFETDLIFIIEAYGCIGFCVYMIKGSEL